MEPHFDMFNIVHHLRFQDLKLEQRHLEMLVLKVDQQVNDLDADLTQYFSYGAHCCFGNYFIEITSNSYFFFANSKFIIELMKLVEFMVNPK